MSDTPDTTDTADSPETPVGTAVPADLPDDEATSVLGTPVQPLTNQPATQYGTPGTYSRTPAPAPLVTTGSRPAARMRTMVFGLILLVVAGSVLVGQLTSVNVDPGVVALALMVGAGLLLVAGSRRAHD